MESEVRAKGKSSSGARLPNGPHDPFPGVREGGFAVQSIFPESVTSEQWAEFSADGFAAPVCGIVFVGGQPRTCIPLGGIGIGWIDLNADEGLGRTSLFNSFAPPRPLNSPFLGIVIGGTNYCLATTKLSNVVTSRRLRYWGHHPVADPDIAIFYFIFLLIAYYDRVNLATAVPAIMSQYQRVMTAATPVYGSGPLDLALHLAAVIVGIQESSANLARVLAPVSNDYLMKGFSWNVVFAVTAGVCAVGGATTSLAFGKAEPHELDQRTEQEA